MSDGSGKAIYSIDTNVLMDWQSRYFPTDVFSSLITCVDELIAQERWISPKIVQEELEAVGTSELTTWAKARPEIFTAMEEVLAEALSIQTRFPGLIDSKAEHEEADAYIIALARIRDGVVVTQETPASEKRNPKRTHFIPDVCREMGVPSISFLGLMRREGWKF